MELFLSNLLSWSLQVCALAALGAALPMVFRLRHPRTHLTYCHAVLAACLLLPFVQPWRHPVVPALRLVDEDVESSSRTTPPRVLVRPPAAATGVSSVEIETSRSLPSSSIRGFVPPPGWSVSNIVIGILAAGFVVRMGWLLLGLWRIRNYRIGATPLYPIPGAVQAAAAVTHANALFCLSPDVPGPVTLGWLAPVVLLPETFVELSEEAQCAIACHELLHVRRQDWLVTLLEESAGALLWFNPGIWMLLAQTRLIREQLVDAEVVRLTSAREPYIDALLAIARGRQVLDLAPAPLFLRRRHLTQRMHALLKDASISKFRLLSSYGSMTAMLGVTVWFALGSFPLVGDPQVQAGGVAGGITAAPQQVTATPHSSVVSVNVRQVAARTARVTPPVDVHEPITGIAQATAEPADRAAALFLLERAKQSSKLHMPNTPPFALKVAFHAWGDVAYTGPGELTENWRTGQDWRWSARLGSYSNTQFSAGGRILSTSAPTAIPIRVQMLRAAIFWSTRATPSSADIRTAAVQWNGKPATCVLFAPSAGSGVPDGFGRDVPDGRRWNDEEYCFDTATGLLQVYSFVPGSYVVYGYGKNRQFHGRTEPDQIIFYNGGAQVMDAQVELTDLGDVEPNATASSETSVPAVAMGIPMRVPIVTSNGPFQGPTGNAIIHATLDPAGKLIEAEVITATDLALGQKSLNSIKSGAYPVPRAATGKRGNALQREMFFDIRVE